MQRPASPPRRTRAARGPRMSCFSLTSSLSIVTRQIADQSGCLPRSRLRNQNDLADVLAIGDQSMRVTGAVEREGFGDDRRKASRLEHRHQWLQHSVEALFPIPPRE